MGKESKKGSDFYKSKGLRALTIHIPADAYEKLSELAKKDERSVQVTARRLLVSRLEKIEL